MEDVIREDDDQSPPLGWEDWIVIALLVLLFIFLASRCAAEDTQCNEICSGFVDRIDYVDCLEMCEEDVKYEKMEKEIGRLAKEVDKLNKEVLTIIIMMTNKPISSHWDVQSDKLQQSGGKEPQQLP